MLLKGNVFITSDDKVALECVYGNNINNFRLISLDEDNKLSIDKNLLISGTCLLPPIDAKIAELDGDERKYDIIYSSHLINKFNQQFMSAILGFLYTGGNIMFYYPNSEYDNTKEKFKYHMFGLYGIHIGDNDSNNEMEKRSFYDINKTYIWADLLYKNTKIISWREYLYNIPLEYRFVDQDIFNSLLMDILPLGNSYDEKINRIKEIHKKILNNPNLIIPLKQKVM